MKNDTIRIVQDYGPARRGIDYLVIKTGYDYVMAKVHGKPLLIPNYLIGDVPDPVEDFEQYEDEDVY